MTEKEVAVFAESMSRDEKSQLLYFETRAVDKDGKVDAQHMNAADREIAYQWSKSGFVEYGRICAADGAGQWCHLSEDAYAVAAFLRKVRAERAWVNKDYTTTKELHD